MPDEMKSAYDRAMERIKSLEEPSKEEVLTWKYVPEGQKLAVRFLKEEFNLASEMGKFKDEREALRGQGGGGGTAAETSYCLSTTLPRRTTRRPWMP